MDQVHVFISTGRFRSFGEMRRYIDPRYTPDGDFIPSAFMQEVGLSGYEPGCIEALLSVTGRPAPLSELLVGASYADQWIVNLDWERQADAAICVYSPNELAHPDGSTLEYLGAFPYRHENPEWLDRLISETDSAKG
jgi:hypothetical protein